MKADDFHAHLDKCEQCRDHPMGLCTEGARILEAVVIEYKSAKALKGIFA